VLAAHGLKATFFVVGSALREHRALVERARAEGHWVGNHTLTHPRPLGESSDPAAEIAATQAELGALAHPFRFFRPSGAGGAIEPGLLSAAAVDALVAGQYTCVLWNSVPGDWKSSSWVETALADIASRPWTLLVLHDVDGGCAERLDEFLGRVDADVKQGFPGDCVPIMRGRVMGPLDALLA
jgi:peptidoglycan/xylan/chitin deacetylase (PgdA/CDA1 family)